MARIGEMLQVIETALRPLLLGDVPSFQNGGQQQHSAEGKGQQSRPQAPRRPVEPGHARRGLLVPMPMSHEQVQTIDRQ